MKILSIETSSNTCSVAILENSNIVKEISIPDQKTHSTILMPTIEKILNETNLTLDNIDLLCCSVGPGSFTGIRIGISTIKSFAMVKNIPIAPIPSLLALSYNIQVDTNFIICSLIDARNDNVYCGIFDNNHNLLENYFSESINNTIDKLKKYTNNIFFVGDGSIIHKDILQENFTTSCFGINTQNLVNAASVGIAGFFNSNSEKTINYHTLEPLYLRPAQAERFVTKVDLHYMTLQDLEEIKSILNSEFDDFWNYNVFKEELENENSTYIVAKQNNSIVGFGGVWQSVDDMHITNIVTKKDLRHIGIGSSILEKLIEVSKNKKMKSLTLEVRQSNIYAINLYTKYNFKQLGNRKDYYQNPTEDAIIMTINF